MHAGLGRRVAGGFDIVPVGIAHERSEVILVIFGPQSRSVQDLSSALYSRIEESLHGTSIGRAKGDMGLAKTITAVLGSDPERRHRSHAETNHLAEIHYPATAQGCEHRVVKTGALRYVGALN